jgi:acetolactate synthase-1/3 small subunit
MSERTGIPAEHHHTLSILVENQPSVLARVAGLFSRRGFNIDSLAVGPTERSDQSRVTIRVDCEQHTIDQVKKQLYKLINVLKVNEMYADTAIERELLLVKVTATPEKRPELVSLANVFGARVADVGASALVFEIVDHPDQLASFEELLRPYGIKEMVRTGRIAIRRASAGTARRQRLRVLA